MLWKEVYKTEAPKLLWRENVALLEDFKTVSVHLATSKYFLFKDRS